MGRYGDDLPLSHHPPHLWHHLGPRLFEGRDPGLQQLGRRRMVEGQPTIEGRFSDAPLRRRRIGQRAAQDRNRDGILRGHGPGRRVRGLRGPKVRSVLPGGPESGVPHRGPRWDRRIHAIHQVHPEAHHRLPNFQHASGGPHGLRRSLREVSNPQNRVPGNRLHLGPLLPGQNGRGVGEAGLAGGPRLRKEAQRVPQERAGLLPRRAFRVPGAPGHRDPG